MGSYSFKSSGKTTEKNLIERIESTRLPVGIKTPLELSSGDSPEIFVMRYSLIDTVKDNLRNLLLTNWGERLGFYKFGANLRPLLTDYVSQDDFDSAAIQRIGSAVSAWMPYVSLDNFLSTVDKTAQVRGIVKITIAISYTVPDLDSNTRSLELTLSAI